MNHTVKTVLWAVGFLVLLTVLVITGVAILGDTYQGSQAVEDLNPLAFANLFFVNVAIFAAAVWIRKPWVLIIASLSLLLDAHTRLSMGVTWMAVANTVLGLGFLAAAVIRWVRVPRTPADEGIAKGWDAPQHRREGTTTWSRTVPGALHTIEQREDGQFEASITPDAGPHRLLGVVESFATAEALVNTAKPDVVASTDTVDGWQGPHAYNEGSTGWARPYANGQIEVVLDKNGRYEAYTHPDDESARSHGTFARFDQAVERLAEIAPVLPPKGPRGSQRATDLSEDDDDGPDA